MTGTSKLLENWILGDLGGDVEESGMMIDKGWK